MLKNVDVVGINRMFPACVVHFGAKPNCLCASCWRFHPRIRKNAAVNSSNHCRMSRVGRERRVLIDTVAVVAVLRKNNGRFYG